MKVKVTPPYEGAGSFEVEIVNTTETHLVTAEGDQFRKSYCEQIPEITPEPGDIVEVWDDSSGVMAKALAFFIYKNPMNGIVRGNLFTTGKDYEWEHCRVLARKPKRWTEAKDAVWRFWSDIADSSKDGERAAYERFLAEILGVPYARVDHD